MIFKKILAIFAFSISFVQAMESKTPETQTPETQTPETQIPGTVRNLAYLRDHVGLGFSKETLSQETLREKIDQEIQELFAANKSWTVVANQIIDEFRDSEETKLTPLKDPTVRDLIEQVVKLEEYALSTGTTFWLRWESRKSFNFETNRCKTDKEVGFRIGEDFRPNKYRISNYQKEGEIGGVAFGANLLSGYLKDGNNRLLNESISDHYEFGRVSCVLALCASHLLMCPNSYLSGIAERAKKQLHPLCCKVFGKDEEFNKFEKRLDSREKARYMGMELIKFVVAIKIGASKKGDQELLKEDLDIIESNDKSDVGRALKISLDISKLYCDGGKYSCNNDQCSYLEKYPCLKDDRLILLPLTKEQEAKLLGCKVNFGVKKDGLFESGETFHPRLPQKELKNFESQIVVLYENLLFKDTSEVIKEIDQKLGFKK